MKSHSVMECSKADKRIVELEARLAEAQNRAAQLCGQLDDAEARLAEANARAEGFQKTYEDALTGNQAILQRLTISEADAARLRAALEAIMAEEEQEMSQWTNATRVKIIQALRPVSRDAEQPAINPNIAALVEAATAAYDLFVSAAMDGDKWIEKKLGAALKPFRDIGRSEESEGKE